MFAMSFDSVSGASLLAGPPRARPAFPTICTGQAAPLSDSSVTFRDGPRDGTLRGSTTLGAGAPRAAALLRLQGAAPRKAPDVGHLCLFYLEAFAMLFPLLEHSSSTFLLVAQLVKDPPAVQETQVQTLDCEDFLEKEEIGRAHV